MCDIYNLSSLISYINLLILKKPNLQFWSQMLALPLLLSLNKWFSYPSNSFVKARKFSYFMFKIDVVRERIEHVNGKESWPISNIIVMWVKRTKKRKKKEKVVWLIFPILVALVEKWRLWSSWNKCSDIKYQKREKQRPLLNE